MTRNEKQFIFCLFGPLCLLIPAAFITFFLFGKNVAFLVGWGGTVLVLFANFLYIGFIDSKKRWPGKPFWVRIGNVFFLQR